MLNASDNIDKLKFKRIITKESKMYLSEWCKEISLPRKIDCVNASSFDRVGNIAVFNENINGDMYVALVDKRDIY